MFPRSLHCTLLALVLAAITFFEYSTAAADASECSVRSRGSQVMIVVCPPGLEQEDWHTVGTETCGSLELCNVWIWDDAAKAPEMAPDNDDGLTKSQVSSAVAVWVNDVSQMLLLRKVK